MEQKKENKDIAEQARVTTLKYLRNKHPNLEDQRIFDAFELNGINLGLYQKEYDKKYEELYKNLEKESKSENKKEDFNKELEQKNKTIEELTDTLKRLQAEFENYKKWNSKEKTEFIKYAHADVVAQLLPVLDSFEIALKSTSDKEKFIQGMKMIYAQFHSVLESEGLKPIKATGEKFDPYMHEVLMKEESDKPEDTVLEEFQKGYMLNDKVLRHSKVKISGK